MQSTNCNFWYKTNKNCVQLKHLTNIRSSNILYIVRKIILLMLILKVTETSETHTLFKLAEMAL